MGNVCTAQPAVLEGGHATASLDRDKESGEVCSTGAGVVQAERDDGRLTPKQDRS